MKTNIKIKITEFGCWYPSLYERSYIDGRYKTFTYHSFLNKKFALSMLMCGCYRNVKSPYVHQGCNNTIALPINEKYRRIIPLSDKV